MAIQQESYNHLNILANHFQTLSTAYAGISEGVTDKGFSEFAKWESYERWETAKMIKKFIRKLGHEFLIAVLESPIQDFKSMDEAFKHMLAQQETTVTKIKVIMKVAFELGDYEVFNLLNDVLEISLDDLCEVREVCDERNMVAGDKAAIYMQSNRLYDKFNPMNEKA